MEYEPPRIGTLTDKESVLAAVTQCGLVLRYADDDLRLDKEIVLAAIQQNGRALRYADEDLRANNSACVFVIDPAVNLCVTKTITPTITGVSVKFFQ